MSSRVPGQFCPLAAPNTPENRRLWCWHGRCFDEPHSPEWLVKPFWDKTEVPIEQEILRYLARHPAAQDTLEGIVEWWVLEETIKQATGDVKAVLAKLVAQGLIEEVEGSDGRVYYHAKRSKVNKSPGPSETGL